MSHRPVSYLRRCQQTGPHAGVHGGGARGGQGGARGHHGGDDNTVRQTHTHKMRESRGERRAAEPRAL